MALTTIIGLQVRLKGGSMKAQGKRQAVRWAALLPFRPGPCKPMMIFPASFVR